MKISKIKISNLFTFPYLKSFNEKKGVIFDAKERNNFNILIGPNGSGKSNFLYTISQVFRNGLVYKYSYDKQILESNDIKNFKKVIKREEVISSGFVKHFLSSNKLSKVGITLKLNQNDFENIGFMFKYTDLLNNIISKYSNLNIKFEKYSIYDLIFEHDIYVEFLINIEKGTMRIVNYNSMSNRVKQILFYIQNMELLQICMNIYNDFEKLDHQRKLYSLKNTFALLESERNILYDNTGEYKPFVIDSIANRSQDIELHKSHKFASVTVGYNLFIIKLIKSARDYLANNGKNYSDESLHTKVSALKKTYFFRDVSNFVQRLLNLNLDIEIRDNKQILLTFANSYGKKDCFENLSSGEKSIIMVLFSLFGYDLFNGFFIIDEPELHLHPYLLKNTVEILKEIGNKFNIQFILATHSPVLIDEQTINNVYKFTYNDGTTTISYPEAPIRANEASLIHILKFENISKIFFINKILMVEGETDEYFWRFFLNYLSTLPKYQGKLFNFEILNINGKGSYSKWNKFLKRFGINSYFIGDWDNIIENNIIDNQEMQEYINLAKQYYDSEKIRKEKFYIKIIETIKTFFPEKYEYIKDRIQYFYDHDIFILKRGDLEAYLGLQKKGLEETINFCNKHFDFWLNNNDFQKHIKELEEIVDKIFSI